jgi:hypothetical protein
VGVIGSGVVGVGVGMDGNGVNVISMGVGVGKVGVATATGFGLSIERWIKIAAPVAITKQRPSSNSFLRENIILCSFRLFGASVK